MRIKILFAYYDFWVGFYWDSKNKWLYFLPVPTLGLIFKFGKSGEEIVKEMLARNDARNLLIDMVNKEIAEEARDEAMLILDAARQSIREEFAYYHNCDDGNLCCLVLDLGKQQLVKEGKMVQRENDHFGNFPGMDPD
jgi:hypothetical protein